MKTHLSSLAIIVLLATLGLLTVIALPRGMDTATASAPQAPSIEVASAPEAPDVTNVYNDIAIPLDIIAQFASLGYTFDADGLASFIGRSSVKQVLWWDPTLSPPRFELWIPNPTTPGQGSGSRNFPLSVGGSYFVLVDQFVNQTASFVGNVPSQTGQPGAIKHNLVGSSPNCIYNMIMIPLDQSTIKKATDLSVALGGPSVVSQVLDWDTTLTPPQFRLYLPSSGGPDNFDVKLGYPYFVCMRVSATWPN